MFFFSKKFLKFAILEIKSYRKKSETCEGKFPDFAAKTSS